VIVEVSGPLHYAAIASMERRFAEVVPASAARVILDVTHAQEMRYAALQWLERLAAELHARDAELELAGVDARFAVLMARARSELSFTRFEPGPGRAVHRALHGEASRSPC